MSEKMLRNIFIFGTLFFLLVLAVMSANSLAQVMSDRTPPVTDQVVSGKLAWQGKDCNDCHTILGIGGYYAPDLTKVVDRRGAGWISAWLKDPVAVNPAATMPNQNLTAAEIADVGAFLGWVNQVKTNNWPPQPLALGSQSAPTSSVSSPAAGAPSASAAEALFQQKGCIGCHRINGKGATGPGPDLSHIASQPYDALPNSPDFLKKWIQNPPAQKPGTIMPAIPMTSTELDTLVNYLSSLK